MLDAVPGRADPGEAQLFGGRADALDDGGDRGVADGVEARLEAASVQATTCAATASASR